MVPKPFAAAIELARNATELSGCLIAKLHQVLRDHREFGTAVRNPLRQDFEQRLQASCLGPHRHDRTGEALGFLAAGAAEDQPGEAKEGKRSRSNRNPLRDLRRGKRLAAEYSAGGPG